MGSEVKGPRMPLGWGNQGRHSGPWGKYRRKTIKGNCLELVFYCCVLQVPGRGGLGCTGKEKTGPQGLDPWSFASLHPPSGS